MKYKNISSKFTLQTHAKDKNTKVQTCLHEIFLLSHQSVKKHIPPECLTFKIQTLQK